MIPLMHGARTNLAMAVWLACGLGCQAPDGSQLFTSGGGAAGEAGAGGASDAGAGGTGAGSGAGGSGTGGSGAAGSGGSGGDAQGGNAALDAGGDADALEADSGSAAADAGTEPGCGGVLVEAVCWYLGANGQSCDQACAARGGVDPGAEAIVGTAPQGGSAAQCASVLSALSGAAQVDVTNGNRTDGLGIGCHLFGEAEDAWWLTTPAFSTSAAVPEAQIACGCNQ